MTRTRDSRLQRGPLARLAWRITLWSNERARTKRSQRELQERYVGTFGGLGGPGSAMSSGAPAHAQQVVVSSPLSRAKLRTKAQASGSIERNVGSTITVFFPSRSAGTTSRE